MQLMISTYTSSIMTITSTTHHYSLEIMSNDTNDYTTIQLTTILTLKDAMNELEINYKGNASKSNVIIKHLE